jgi:hypothetical protein
MNEKRTDRRRPGPWRLAPLVLLLLASARSGRAELCAIDQVPAATLLVPYFELDLAPGAGDDVILSINNSEAQAALAHVTFWTDWAQPTVSFEIYLTGFDVQAFSLRQAFASGDLPITADLQSDPGDTISPSPGPGAEASFPNCQNFFPFYVNPILTGNRLERLRDGHTGQPIAALGNRCLGADRGDQVARGYITVDSVSRCSVVFPNDSSAELPYFAQGGTGIANNRNTLWGDYVMHRAADTDVEPLSMVHVEAGASLPGPTGYTFYGSFASAAGGKDNREPLGSVWAVGNWRGEPIWMHSPAQVATDLLVWRDPTAAPAAANGLVCGVGPDWAPLPQNSVYCFDESENLAETCLGDSCFPLAAQRVAVGGQSGFENPFDYGWCRFDLGLEDERPVSGDKDFPGGIAQSYIASLMSYDTLSTVGLPAVLLRGACQEAAPTFLEIHIFRDGFESGNTSAWSQVIP